MTYVNAIKYLNAHVGGTPSPERMRLLCRYLGDPQKNMKFVHIAGGRGKTSCSVMLSVILTESGFTVGSLISSHIEEHRERIRIKNEPLTHKDFAEYIHRVSLAAAKMKADIDLAAELSASDQEPAEGAIQHKITKNLLDGKIAPEPTEEEIFSSVISHDLSKIDELVFCGYGEPSYRLAEARAVSLRLKENYPKLKIRINTNGQSDLILGFSSASLYKDAFDTVSISLNSPSAEEYDRICHSKFGPQAFSAILKFTSEVKKYVPDTRLSVVSEFISLSDIEKCRCLADELGVTLRVRDYIPPET